MPTQEFIDDLTDQAAIWAETAERLFCAKLEIQETIAATRRQLAESRYLIVEVNIALAGGLIRAS
jgi:hypothetical protein